MSVLYNNIEETAIRTGEARTRLPFQSHNDCQIVEEDYVQKASAFTHITRLSQSANGGAEAVLDGGAVTAVNITAAGSGFSTAPAVTVNGDGSSATASAVIEGDKLSSIEVTGGGSGYTVATLTIGEPVATYAWLRSDTNPDAVIVEEGKTMGIDCGLVEFTRVFSEVPPQRIEYEQISFQQPAIYSTTTIQSKAAYMAMPVAKATYDYFLTAPEYVPTITLSAATSITAQTPTLDDAYSGNTVLAQDDSLTRWMGDIWERKRLEVTLQ